MIVEVKSERQADNMHKGTTVENLPCETSAHPNYNDCKGLVYTYEFDIESLEDFNVGLQERYNISDVQPANFIKTKSDKTRAFIVYFNQKNLPYNIYIPGEVQDTRVQPFRNKPLICNKCQGYGHSRKWCRSTEDIRRKCSAIGHDATKCTTETSQCYYCKENQTGSRKCARQQKEHLLVEIQDKEKVTIRKARQILEGESEVPARAANRFPTHYNCAMEEKSKRKFSSCLEKCINNYLGSKPRSIRTLNKTTFILEVTRGEQGAALARLKELNSTAVKVEENTDLSVSKGMIDIYAYNLLKF